VRCEATRFAAAATVQDGVGLGRVVLPLGSDKTNTGSRDEVG